MIKVEKLIESFKLRKFGSKGWMTNASLACPTCGRTGKFGFKINENGGAVNCFFCDYSTHVAKYLTDVGRKDLIIYDKEISLKSCLKSIVEEETDEVIEISEVELPRGFTRLKHDDYLAARGWVAHHYEEYQVGVTNHVLTKKLRNYLIFSIFQDGKRLSWLARTKHDYSWHKKNIEQAKEGIADLIPRYRNSDGTEFDNIVGGIDSVTENTHTIILVEGLFDATNTDTVLKLYESEEVKVCFTFGNKVSDAQMNIIKKKKSVDTIILMYDYGTIKQSKSYGLRLCRYWKTYVTLNENPDIDPGNMDLAFANCLLKNKKDALDFYLSTLEVRSL